jgi:hypothetical protein
MKLGTFKGLFFAAVALGAASALTHAKAAEEGQCFSPSELNNAMHSDEQMSVAKADEPEDLTGTNLERHWGWIFTKNANGSLGYIIRTNAESGKPFTQACIKQKLHDVILKDFRVSNYSVPSDLILPSEADRSVMASICERENARTICGPNNELLNGWNKDGIKVMYYGINTEGQVLALLGSDLPKLNGGLALTDPVTGTLAMRHDFEEVKYRQQYIQAPDARVAQAVPGPKIN